MLRRRLPLDLIKKRELRARHMLHLFPKRPNAVEISLRGNVRILLLRHRFRNAQKSLFRPPQREAHAPRNALRNVLLLRQRGRSNQNHTRKNKKSKKLHGSLQLNRSLNGQLNGFSNSSLCLIVCSSRRVFNVLANSQVDRALLVEVSLPFNPLSKSLERCFMINFHRCSARIFVSPKERYAQKNRPTQ